MNCFYGTVCSEQSFTCLSMFLGITKANTTMAELPLWVQLSKRQEMESYLCYYFVWHICSRRALSILNRWPRILADLRTRQGEGVCHENDHQSKGTQPGLSWSLGTNITLLCFQSRASAESAPSFGSTCRSTVRILVHQVSSVPHQWMVPSHTVKQRQERSVTRLQLQIYPNLLLFWDPLGSYGLG